MNYPEEVWRPVPDWERHYEVSNHGRVRRIAPYVTWLGNNAGIDPRTGKRFGQNPLRIVKPMLKDGRPTVCLSRGTGTEKWPSVHTLVAMAFVGPRPSPRHSVNHVNGDKADNRAENLEWATNRQQQLHSISNGLRDDSQYHKLTPEQAREIYATRDTISGREWARRLGVTSVAISQIRSGRTYRNVTGAPPYEKRYTWYPCESDCECRCHQRR
jgi:hypothetical protein